MGVRCGDIGGTYLGIEASRTHLLHGQNRRRRTARRNADDNHPEAGVLKNSLVPSVQISSVPD